MAVAKKPTLDSLQRDLDLLTELFRAFADSTDNRIKELEQAMLTIANAWLDGKTVVDIEKLRAWVRAKEGG